MINNPQQLFPLYPDYNRPFSDLIEMLLSHSAKFGDKDAYIFLEDGINEKYKISYHELFLKSSAVASVLQQNHKNAERCLLLFPSGLEFIIGLYGCILSGLIAIPTYPPKRNRIIDRFWAILEDSEATVILTSGDTGDKLLKNFGEDERLKGIETINIDHIDSLSSYNWKNPEVDPDDPVIFQYTSGSTGWPRGVMATHNNVLSNLEVVNKSFNHSENLVSVGWLPHFHDMGLFGTLIQPFYVGGVSIFMSPSTFIRYPLLWLKAITKYKATTVGGPNFTLDHCVSMVHDEDLVELDLSSIKVFFCGAEPIRKSSFEKFDDKFRSCGFKPEMYYPCYGLAEYTLMAAGGDHFVKPTYLSVDAAHLEETNKFKIAESSDNARVFVGNGYPWVGGKIMIVNPYSGKLSEPDAIGEIWLSGPSVCQGYWNNPEETKETFQAYTADSNEGPFLRTGDLGFIYDGQLYVTGRLKDMIIIRGQNHYPQDIEKTVENCHESLREYANAVFSIDVAGEERLAVVQEVERTYLRNLNQEEVFEAIRKAVAEEHEIQVYAIVLIRTGSINKTTSGKIMRRASKKAFLDNNLNIIANWEMDLSKEYEDFGEDISTDSVEEWLVNWLARKVKMDPKDIDPDKPILSYGLDSMGAVELEREVTKQFGIGIELSDFLENNKISDLAAAGVKMIKDLERG